MANIIHLGWFARPKDATPDAREYYEQIQSDADEYGLTGTYVITRALGDRPIRGDNRFGAIRGYVLLFTVVADVADDAWSALVFLRLVRSLAAKFRDGIAIVFDDGTFILPGSVRIQGSFIGADPRRMDLVTWQRRVEQRGSPVRGVPITPVLTMDPGIFFPNIGVANYARESAIRDLGLSEEELKSLTLEEAAARVHFRWESDPDGNDRSK